MVRLKSITKTVPIHDIDENIFTARYRPDCLKNDCQDLCCSHGCSVDPAEVDRILVYKQDLERRLGRDAEQCFQPGVIPAADFPSGHYRRTMVYDGVCVFHDWSSRGCLLHRMAIEKGIDPHKVKPMACFLFPLSWDGEKMCVVDYIDELPCRGDGGLILDSVMDEIKYYFGEESAAEIELLKNKP